MSSAEEYVDGKRIQIFRLVSVVIGSILVAIWSGWMGIYQAIGDAITELVTSPVAGFAEIVGAIAGMPADIIQQAWSTVAASIISAGELLGPFIYPATIVLTLLTLMLIEWAVRQMVEVA